MICELPHQIQDEREPLPKERGEWSEIGRRKRACWTLRILLKIANFFFPILIAMKNTLKKS